MKEPIKGPVYDLTPAQDMIQYMLKYSFFHKQVTQIPESILTEKEIDFKLMEQAINIEIERNDCMRLRFFKEKGKIKQYFLDHYEIHDIPVLKFNSMEEQAEVLTADAQTPIRMLKDETYRIKFFRSFDGRWGVNSRLIPQYDVISDPGQYYEMHYQMLYNQYLYSGHSVADLKDGAPMPKELGKYEDGIMKITGDKILPWTFNTAYTKLYKMELFTKTGFLFPEGIALCEDFYVSYKIFDYLDHFYFLNKALYHYYVRSDSILHSVKENQVDKAIEAIKDLQDYLDSRNNKVLQISVDNEKVAMRQRYFYDFDGVRAEKWMNVFPELTDQNLQRIRNDFKKKNSELKSAQNDIKHLKNEISKLNRQVRELEEKTKVYRKERSGIKTFLYTIKHKGPKQTFKLCINKIKGHF